MRTAVPYLALAAALAIGTFLGCHADGFTAFWPLAALACLLAILFGYGLRLRHWPCVATFLLGLAAAASAESARLGTLARATHANGPFVCDVRVTSADGRAFYGSSGNVRLKVILADGLRSDSSAAGSGTPAGDSPRTGDSHHTGDSPRAGDVWRVAGWLERRDAADRFTRRLWVKGAATSAHLVARGFRTRFNDALAAVRSDLARRAGIGLDHAPDIAMLNRAILLGERTHLPYDLKRAFVDAGTIHVFAISGLHVGVVAMTLFWLLVLAMFPVRWTGLVIAPFVWAYVLVIGAPPSAVRAAAMVSLHFLAPAFGRRPDSLVAWCLVFIAVHLINPLQIVHVGSALSFTVMLAIILWSRFFRHGLAFAAWAAGVPIAAHVFGRFTIAGLAANLVLLPAATVSVAAGAIGTGLSYLSTTVAAHINNGAALFTRAMVAVSEAIASIPGASVEIKPWGYAHCAAWYAVLILSAFLAVSIRTRRRQTFF